MTSLNWRRGAFRLWIVVSALWCAGVFFAGLLENKDARRFPAGSPVVHVKISNTVTWDYPAEWGVQRIRDDLQKRLTAEDEKDREWAAQVPASRRDECSAIPPTTPFQDQPNDCNKLFFAKDRRAVPMGWEAQVATAPDCNNGASSCAAWERDWIKTAGLKPGTIVTEQGTVTPPNEVSAWGVIAADAPWAISPPLVVLALGTSLFWAFAGFRRSTS